MEQERRAIQIQKKLKRKKPRINIKNPARAGFLLGKIRFLVYYADHARVAKLVDALP